MSEEEEVFTCCRCNKDIDTTVITACDKTFHLECFLCTGCKNPMSTRRYKQKNNEPYCSMSCEAEPDRICAKCNKIVTGSCMKAVDTVFHPNCFTCMGCGTGIAVKTFFEVKDGAYCSICYKRQLDKAFQAAADDIIVTGPK